MLKLIRQMAALSKAAIAAKVTDLLGFDRHFNYVGGADAGHQAGISGEVRIVAEASLFWAKRSGGHRV